MQDACNDAHLHSNMDRLKRSGGAAALGALDYLHSNMDRLKPRIHARQMLRTHIYIPIWID